LLFAGKRLNFVFGKHAKQEEYTRPRLLRLIPQETITMKKILVCALIGTALAFGASTASAEKLILKFGHVGAPGSSFEASVNEFVRNANDRLGDRAAVHAFGSSPLGQAKGLSQ